MLNYKPKMFEESKKSTASENLIINILVFIGIFLIIILAESVIPTILSYDEIQSELAAAGNSDISTAIAIASRVSMKPKYLIPTLLCTGFGTLISLIYCRFSEARYIRSIGVRKNKIFSHYFQGVLVGLAMMTAIVLISLMFGINNIFICNNINFGLIGLYFLGFLVQGMSEEFIFRGYLMNTLGGKHHTLIAISVSAAAFSLAHLTNPGFNLLTFVNLAMFGGFASIYMICFDDIWGVCAIHSIWNFTQGSLYGISVSGTGNTESIFRTTAKTTSTILSGGDFGIEGSIVTTVVLAVGIAVMLFILRRKIKQNET